LFTYVLNKIEVTRFSTLEAGTINSLPLVRVLKVRLKKKRETHFFPYQSIVSHLYKAIRVKLCFDKINNFYYDFIHQGK
jgi:hypothetical protein